MRKIIIVISCFFVLLLLGYASYRGYQVWKQKHGMAMARGYLAKADVRNTVLSLQLVLKANPRNVDACRLMAELAEEGRSRGALDWRERVLELKPNSFQDRLALAQSALLFQDYQLATNTLTGVAEADKKTSAYQNTAGTAALEGGRLDDAEAHFSESVCLDSNNPIPQVNLAIVKLHRTNTLEMAEARIALRRVITNSTNGSLCSQARRELIVDAMRFDDISMALSVSRDLARQTNAIFADKLLRLNVLMKTGSTEFKSMLSDYEREAAANPAKLFDLASWEISQISPATALGWLQSLPMQARTNQPAALLVADCQVSTKDWRGVQAFLQGQDWNELEFERHAFLARSLREQGLAESSKAEWQLAFNGAHGKKTALNALFGKVAQWNWSNEAEQILWTLVNSFPDEQQAVQTLRHALIVEGRTRSLMQLITIQVRRNPSDAALKNDLAMVALLLDDQDLKPNELARQNYQQDPQNPSIASTYAFSLYLQQKPAEALKVMQRLDLRTLAIPGIGCYYGLILKANGDLPRAKTYLNLSAKAQGLLPEEKTMFTQAEAGL